MAKLRAVAKGERMTVHPRLLRAKQVEVFPQVEGGSTLVMVEEAGGVYVLSPIGWKSLSMVEDLLDDTQV